MSEKTYDKIFIGAGLASLFAAYSTLRLAKDTGTAFKVLLLANEIKAPVAAGSHFVPQIEGLMEDKVPSRETIQNFLRVGGLHGLRDAITREDIKCRFLSGYEIKGRHAGQAADLLEFISGNHSFTDDEAIDNSANQSLHLPGHPYSVFIPRALGQANTPELLHGLAEAIKNMGGDVVIPAHYENHRMDNDGRYIVETSVGPFYTHTHPFLGTGALHQSALLGDKLEQRISYTGALVIGPLDDRDSSLISSQPMAFCDMNFDGDVLWGGIDPENMLTIGKGDLSSPESLPALESELKSIAENMLNGVTQKYPCVFNHGPMLTAENAMPVAGRMKDYDIAGGWGGLGIIAAFSAAQAFAKWYVQGKDVDLRIFEAMQPKLIQKISL